ncbi:hypothetical protein C1633_12235, partial [Pseudomonas protegens]
TFRRSRLAGEEGLESCAVLKHAFAGKPAPTGGWRRETVVGAGLPAKRALSLAQSSSTPSLASQLLRGGWRRKTVVGTGLPAKRALSLAQSSSTPSLASQLLRGAGGAKLL